jgi:hypothetical protein
VAKKKGRAKGREKKQLKKARVNVQQCWYIVMEVFRFRFFSSLSLCFFFSLFLLSIDAFTRVNICVNKCSFFFCAHVYAIDVDVLSMCTHISIHTHTYAYWIVINAVRMHTYSSISHFFLCSCYDEQHTQIYIRVLYYSHIVEMLRKITWVWVDWIQKK